MNTNFVSRYSVNFRRNENIGLLEDGGKQYFNTFAVATFCKRIYEAEDAVAGYCEYCYALLLDRANHLNGYVKISEGGLCATLIDNRKVVKAALDANTDAVILVHNHPSGNPRPGKADIEATDGLRQCLKLFNMRLLDHIILSEDSFFSFADDREQSF